MLLHLRSCLYNVHFTILHASLNVLRATQRLFDGDASLGDFTHDLIRGTTVVPNHIVFGVVDVRDGFNFSRDRFV